MSQDRNENFYTVSDDDIMVQEVSSSTPDISETRSPDSTFNLMVGTMDSNDASPPISQEVADEHSNTGDFIVGTTDSNAASSSFQEVADEYSNTGDLLVGTTDSNAASSSTFQKVADEYSNTGDLVVGTTDSNAASSSTFQEVADEYSNTGDLVVGTTDSNAASSSTFQEVADEYSNTGDLVVGTTDSNDASSSILQDVAEEYSNTGDLMIGNMDGNDASSSISQEVSDEYSNTHNISTVEDHSIAGEFRELVLSTPGASSDDPSRSEDSISTPITSPTQTNTFNSSVDQTKQADDNKKEILLSPSKRHLSSKQEPESKKPNTSEESDLVLLASNYGVEHKETFVLQSPVDLLESVTESAPQRVEDPVLDNLEHKTDCQGCTASNEADETPIFKVPPIPSHKKHTEEIRKDKRKVLAFFDSARLSWETQMQGSRDGALNLNSRAIPSGSGDTNQGPFQYQKDIGEKSQCEITSLGHQPQESSNSTAASNTELSDSNIQPVSYSFPIMLPLDIQPLARNDFIPELESIVDEYMNGIPSESLGEPIVEEHLRPFQTQFTESINRFQSAMEQTLAGIRNLEFSPDLNVSSLVITSSGLLRAAVDVECIWRTFAQLLAENSNSINVINMIHHHTRCLHYFYKFMLAILRYIHTLPDDYPGV